MDQAKKENCIDYEPPKHKVSTLRKLYIVRLVFRCLILAASISIAIYDPSQMKVLEGWNFFHMLTPFHILWVIWVLDMLWQLIPVKNKIALGSQKLFEFRFIPSEELKRINYTNFRNYIIRTTKQAYKVMLLWAAAIVTLTVLRYTNILNDTFLFLFSVTFYVCDLICVLIWCPFRLIMKNRCCTTCRIFNWDHLMMFTPMLLVRGFFSLSLLLMSILVWLVWELAVMMYPERFSEITNEALRCSNCTDKLCTQYCQKLRSPNNPNIDVIEKIDDLLEETIENLKQ